MLLKKLGEAQQKEGVKKEREIREDKDGIGWKPERSAREWKRRTREGI